MKKRIFVVVFLLFFLTTTMLPIFARGAAPVDEPPYVEINFRTPWGGSRFEDMVRMVDEFNNTVGKDEGIFVNLVRELRESGDVTVYASTLISDVMADTVPDILHTSSFLFTELVGRNFYAVPPEEIQQYVRDNFPPAIIEEWTVNGITYGWPNEMQNKILFYNKAHFKEVGLDPEKPPLTWDELREYAKKLTVYDGNTMVRAGFTWNDDRAAKMEGIWESMMQAQGLPLIDADGHNFDTEEALAIMKLWEQMSKDGSTSAGWIEPRNSYPSGFSSMAIGGNWYTLLLIRNQGSEELFQNTGIAHIPSRSGETFASRARSQSLQVYSGSKNLDAAWKFMRWWNEGPESRVIDWMVNELGYAPSKIGWGYNKDYLEGHVAAYEMIFEDLVPPSLISGISEIMTELLEESNAVMYGHKTAEAAMQSLIRTADRVVAEAK